MSEYKPPQYGDQYKAPYDAPGERRGMSGCAKAFLILGILGVVALLCRRRALSEKHRQNGTRRSANHRE